MINIGKFWSYLWGFETCKMYRLLDCQEGVLELPMRVWNSFSFFFLLVFVCRFGVTYEGLKRHVIYLPRFSYHCFGVTYEGLKLGFAEHFAGNGDWFWSYLWGFETFALDLRWLRMHSFGVTYEGLKPRRRTRSLLVLCRFGVTYEGLKRLSRDALTLPLPRFGVTYEGLKQIQRKGTSRGSSTFWSYLWGFETPAVRNDTVPGRTSFWSYLWGFETQVRLLGGNWNGGFGVTYEGLKQGERSWSWCWVGRFGVTYEGLKQGLGVLVG